MAGPTKSPISADFLAGMEYAIELLYQKLRVKSGHDTRGWSEEARRLNDVRVNQIASDMESIQLKILQLQREAGNEQLL